MKKFILGLVSALAVSLPIAANAQSFEPFPGDSSCSIINYICHSTLDDGSPFLAAIPTGYDGRYLISIEKHGVNNLVVVFDLENEQIAAYILVDREGRLAGNLSNGRPGYGGRLQLLDENSEEIVALLIEIELY